MSSELPNNGLHRAAELLVRAKERRILLVEDTPAHAAIIRRGLDSSNWEIHHVTRGSSAVEEFLKDPFQIVLLDLSLPDTDGLTLLGQLRAINSLAVLVVVTATDQVRMSVEAMQRGASDYVVKSDPNETARQIAASAEKAHQRRLKACEAQLIEQTKLVELVKSERLEAIELIVRTVCHEVNNPLSGVVALSQLLSRNEKLDFDLKKMAEGIARSANEVADVVRKLHTITDEATDFGGQKVIPLVPSSPVDIASERDQTSGIDAKTLHETTDE